jgi:hypothetical protein
MSRDPDAFTDAQNSLSLHDHRNLNRSQKNILHQKILKYLPNTSTQGKFFIFFKRKEEGFWEGI